MVKSHVKGPSWLLALLLVLSGFLAWSSARVKSVTVDESASCPHGLAILKTGDFHADAGAAPLPKILTALPLLLEGTRLDTSQAARISSSWAWGRRFVSQNPARYHRLFLAARLVPILFLLLTGLLAYFFSQSLYGPKAGLLTAFFVLLSPNLLAHGRLVTPDIFLAAAMVAALFAFDRFLRRPLPSRALLLGLLLGLAVLFKFTGLLLFLLFPLEALILYAREKFSSRKNPSPSPFHICRATWILGAAALVTGILVVNAGYLFGGIFTNLGSFSFHSGLFRSLQAALPSWLPVPLPYWFFQGLDTQLAETGYPAYLLGQFNHHGFPAYYLAAFLVKTPVPTLALALLALFVKPRFRPREFPYVATGILLFLFFSLASHKNIGIRYVLFLFPLLGIWIGRLAADPPPAPAPARKPKFLQPALFAGAAWLLAALAWVHPHYLPFFNLPSGGPSKGHEYLLDSNLDWGQDLVALKEYMKKEKIPSLDLAYWGRVPPQVYGIAYNDPVRVLPQKDAQGRPKLQFPYFRSRYLAVSANFLWGRMYFMNGTGFWPSDRDAFAAFRNRRPKALLGYTIYVFDLEKDRGR